MTIETNTFTVKPARRVRGVRAYRRGTSSENSITLWLDANEGASLPATLLNEILSPDPEVVRKYPDAARVEARIASRWGLDPVDGAARVVLTNGGDDAIDRICRSVLEPGRTAVVHEPSFEMIRRSAQLAGAEVRGVQWVDGIFPTREFINQIDDRTGLVALVTPNNPTGLAIPTSDLLEISAAAQGVGAAALIDLAYAEFAENDPTRELLRLENVVIVRTFSKAWGMAGLRVGYAIAGGPLADWVRTAGGPFPVSGLALRAVELALKQSEGPENYVIRAVCRVQAARTELTSLLQELGAHPIESQANFVLVRVGDAPAVDRGLRGLGIAVRAFDSKPELVNTVRITVPSEPVEYQRLEAALRASERVSR
ncbi:MAG: histidinol-phosphate aminotransferase [Phycisphaerales bacterium]|jgi:histidinol-phosphate aminotransferase